MRTIWKYPFPILDDQEIMLREGAIVRHVGLQDNTPCLWVEVDPDAPTEDYLLMIVGTGHKFPNVYSKSFVGTFLMPPFVWHVFLWPLKEKKR